MTPRWKILIFIWLTGISLLQAQDTINFQPETILFKLEENGDTVFYASIADIYIFPDHSSFKPAERRRYNKLILNVKRVYPYAKMAGAEYAIVSEDLLKIQTDKERRTYINALEDRIMSEYEEDLKKLTISQGRILLKMIDREIGQTSYEVLKDFKGTISAVFWQTLARIFGNNLKSEFDADGEDKLLNEIIIQIENGQL
jgi:hypothetical protein